MAQHSAWLISNERLLVGRCSTWAVGGCHAVCRGMARYDLSVPDLPWSASLTYANTCLRALTKEEAQLTREKDKIQMGRAEQHVSKQREDGESERLQPWRKRPPQTLRRRSCAAARSCWRTSQS